MHFAGHARTYLATTAFGFLLLQKTVGEDDLDDCRDCFLTGPVALQLAGERDPADGLPASRSASSAVKAMQTSVHSAQMMSFRRPVARTAWTNSRSSQELTVVRSSGLSPASRAASSGSVGPPWPDATLTVECTTGTPKVLIVLTVETAFVGELVADWRTSHRSGTFS